MKMRCLSITVFALCGLVAHAAPAALYKWVDSRGVVHYSDRLPESSRTAPTRLNSSGVATKPIEPRSAPGDQRLSGPDPGQNADAKRQLDQQRQDSALLATYATESEIDAAREREQKRHQEMLKLTTSGLAGSSNPDDRRKLDSLLLKGQQEADAINARFQAQKLRFRELTAGRKMAHGEKPDVPAPPAQ